MKFEDIYALLAGAGTTDNADARVVYVASARAKLAEATAEVARLETLVVAAETELARRGKRSP